MLVFETANLGDVRHFVAQQESGAAVASCVVRPEYAQCLSELLHDLEADDDSGADAEPTSRIDALPGMASTNHPITGAEACVPFFMLSGRQQTLQPGAVPLFRGLTDTAEDPRGRLRQQREELCALTERLQFLVQEMEADWNEARANGDRALARKIRLFGLEPLRRRGLWVAPAARRR